MYRITQDQIDELEIAGQPSSLVSKAKQWLIDCQYVDHLISVVEAAFSDVKLGSGVGLFEAQGLDNYATESELQALRSKDEKEDWRRIPAEHLNQCYSSPSFFDTAGLVFHLPAFIRAELNGTHNFGFLDRLIHDSFSVDDIRGSLTDPQRAAIMQCLEFLLRCPDYENSADDIRHAIDRYGLTDSA